MVPLSEIVAMGDSSDRCLIYTSWVFAFMNGLVYPMSIILMGEVIDSFSPEMTPEETLEQVELIFGVMGILALVIVITTYINTMTSVKAAARIASKIKIKYLKAILDQESAWFDQTNINELSGRLENETTLIQRGIGDKFNQLLFSSSMLISGLGLAFSLGWSLALAMLGIVPILGIGIKVFFGSLGGAAIKNLKAYG